MGYLVFQEHTEGHVLVTNKKRQYLGKLMIKKHWNCWVYSPANDSLCDDNFMWFSQSCLHEICSKLKELNGLDRKLPKEAGDRYGFDEGG